MKKQRQSVNILISGIRTAKAGILSLFPVDIITVDRYTESEDEVITMQVRELMSQKGLTMYRLSKVCNLPYTTINDICSGKARLEKCSAETVYKLAKVLQVPMEELLEPHIEQRCSFELFKSNVCHRLKELGDINFVIEVLESDDIHRYYKRKWYPESFYLLAMLDYVCRINQIPICTDYDALRKQRLQKPLYPASILSVAAVSENAKVKAAARKNAIPEFMKFNIVENEVRNVI